MSTPHHITILTTTSTREDARRIADLVVEQRLAACVQIVGPIRSVYRWDGEVVDSEEYRCEIKSRFDLFEQIRAEVARIHPYDVPEVIAIPMVESAPGYRQWLEDQLQDPSI